MAKINLNSMSVTELKALGKRVEKAIERHEAKKKTKALAALKAKAKELGFSLNDLVGGSSKAAKASDAAPKKKSSAKKAKAKVAYRHPDDASKTWAGRGPRPAWLRDELAAGKALESFKV